MALEELVFILIAFVLGVIVESEVVKNFVDKITLKVKRVERKITKLLGQDMLNDLIALYRQKSAVVVFDMIEDYNEEHNTDFQTTREVASHYVSMRAKQKGLNITQKQIERLIDLVEKYIDKLV